MLLSYPSSSLQREWRSWGAFPMWVISIHLAREEGGRVRSKTPPLASELQAEFFPPALKSNSPPGSYTFRIIFFLYIIALRKQNKTPNVLLQSLGLSDEKRSFFTSFELEIQHCCWLTGLGSDTRFSYSPGLGLPGRVLHCTGQV